MFYRIVILFLALLLTTPGGVAADGEVKNHFGKKNTRDFFSGNEPKVQQVPSVPEETKAQERDPFEEFKEAVANVVLLEDDPREELRRPYERQPLRVSKEAPGSFVGMTAALDLNNRELAREYAAQHVQYMVDLLFRVREITQLIGEALLERGVVDDDDWVGVSQYMSIESAKARRENQSLVKATHEDSLKQITEDPNGLAQVYFFFTLNCKWCRAMAPDIERLNRIASHDPNLQVSSMVLGESDVGLLREFAKYTGLMTPVLDGSAAAKKLGIGFVPAVVIVSPSTKKAYLRTGEQSFEHLLEFTRTVQGKPLEMTRYAQALKNYPIGELEKMEHEGSVVSENPAQVIPVGGATSPQEQKLRRF